MVVGKVDVSLLMPLMFSCLPVQNSLFSVESRMKNLAEFEKIVRAQECRLDEMKQFASDLIRQKHYATGEIESRCQLVLDRRDRMWKASVKRQGMLQDSRDYQLFLKNLYEVRSCACYNVCLTVLLYCAFG